MLVLEEDWEEYQISLEQTFDRSVTALIAAYNETTASGEAIFHAFSKALLETE